MKLLLLSLLALAGYLFPTARSQVVETDSSPSKWNCLPEYYNAGDGCHCTCGIYDPDCDTDALCYSSMCKSGICGVFISGRLIPIDGALIDLDGDLDNVQFEEIPSAIGLMSNLNALTLRNIKFTSMPSEIGMLSKLHTMELDGSNLTNLPTQIGMLSSLTDLVLNDNDLINLPTEIGKLSSLRYLSLGSNDLTSLPSEIGLLPLETLDLSHNQLTSLPDELGGVSNVYDASLSFLDARHNLLRSLPSTLGLLSSLQHLDVRNNLLTSLPPELQRLTNLPVAIDEGNGTHIDIFSRSLYFAENILTCDSNLLSWYSKSDIVNMVVDREQVFCSNVNAYGELRLNPHILTIDEESPRSYVSFIFDEVSSRNITIAWEYNYEQALFHNHVGPVDEDEFDEYQDDYDDYDYYEYSGYYYSEYELDQIAEINNRTSILEATFIADIYANNDAHYGYSGAVELEKFRSCQSFDILQNGTNYFDQRYFGFEISWSSVSDFIEKRTCYLGNELIKTTRDLNVSFAYTITDLVPASGYEIRVRPFYVHNAKYYETTRLVFGIQSVTRKLETATGTPLAAPGNTKFKIVNFRDFTMSWDEVSQKGITGYQVNVYADNAASIHGQYFSDIRSVLISNLQPKSYYHCSVRAKTDSDNWGPWSQNVTVRTCPENMRQEEEKGEECFALVGYYRFQEDEAKSCSQISDALEENSCLQNQLNVEELSVDFGYWRDSLLTDMIRKCPKSTFCTKANAKNVTGPDSQCSKNHKGVYCQSCIQGYVLSSSGCEECSEEEESLHGTRIVLFMGVIVLCFVSGILKITWGAGVFDDVRCCLKGNKKMGGACKTLCIQHFSSKPKEFVRLIFNLLAVKIRILFGFFQVLLSFQRTFEHFAADENDTILPWEFFVNFNPRNLADKFRMRCAFDYNHYDTLLLYTLTPIIFVIIVLGIYRLFSWLCIKYRNNILQESITTVFYLTFLIYPGVSQTILETYLCESFPTADGEDIFKSALRSDYRLSCKYSRERVTALVYASFMLLFYPIGIVLLYVAFLKRYKILILKQDTPELDQEGEKKLKRVSFLINPYITKRYWFETYELVRKLAQTSLAAFLQDASFPRLSPVIAMNISIIAVLLLVFMKPYKTVGDFWFAFASLVLLIPASQLSTLEGLDPEQITTGLYGIIGTELSCMVVIVLVELILKRYETEMIKVDRSKSVQFVQKVTPDEFIKAMNENVNMLAQIKRLKDKNVELRNKLSRQQLNCLKEVEVAIV